MFPSKYAVEAWWLQIVTQLSSNATECVFNQFWVKLGFDGGDENKSGKNHDIDMWNRFVKEWGDSQNKSVSS